MISTISRSVTLKSTSIRSNNSIYICNLTEESCKNLLTYFTKRFVSIIATICFITCVINGQIIRNSTLSWLMLSRRTIISSDIIPMNFRLQENPLISPSQGWVPPTESMHSEIVLYTGSIKVHGSCGTYILESTSSEVNFSEQRAVYSVTV